jgi:hypothetical protein
MSCRLSPVGRREYAPVGNTCQHFRDPPVRGREAIKENSQWKLILSINLQKFFPDTCGHDKKGKSGRGLFFTLIK